MKAKHNRSLATAATFDFMQSVKGERPPLLFSYLERQPDGSVVEVKRFASVCTFDPEPFWKRSRGRMLREIDALMERGLFDVDD